MAETTSWELTVTAANQEVFWTPRYSTITVTNPVGNGSIFVTVDGSAAAITPGASTAMEVNAGTTAVFDNELPIQDITSTQTVANLLAGVSSDTTHMTQVNIIGITPFTTPVTIDVE